MTRVFVAGATGSIGQQTFDVIDAVNDRAPGTIEVVGISVNSSIGDAALIAKKYNVGLVIVAGLNSSDAGSSESFPTGCEVVYGTDALDNVGEQADVVVNGIVGFAGLSVTLSALRSGKRLALANKESLVAAGPIVASARATPGAEIVPVDSEHCAIHQCLRSGQSGEVASLVLTSSGGPFRTYSPSELKTVTVADALNHPTWSMGPKITVDSSTLMNKGLEVIEAHELFGFSYDMINVVVHPQSIVHSMVGYRDGSTIAQLSMPTMCGPIGYALGYPDRSVASFGAIDWSQPLGLTFEAPRREVFGALDLAYEAGRRGGGAPAWLNAANEVVVDGFLHNQLTWDSIAPLLTEALAQYADVSLVTPSDVLDVDQHARAVTAELIAKWSRR